MASAKKQIQIMLSKSFEILSDIFANLSINVFVKISWYNGFMAEGAETPDRPENARPQNQRQESQAGPTDAQREAKEDLADKVDDNKVEAAGKKGGLRAALAARMASIAEKNQRFVDKARDAYKHMFHESAVKAGLLGRAENHSFRDELRRQGHGWNMAMLRTGTSLLIGPSELAAKVLQDF